MKTWVNIDKENHSERSWTLFSSKKNFLIIFAYSGGFFSNNKKFVRLVIHTLTAQRPERGRLQACGILNFSKHEHPTLTFDRYSVGIPVCLAKKRAFWLTHSQIIFLPNRDAPSLLLLTSDFYPIAKPYNFFYDCFFLTFKFFLDWKYCFDLGLVSSTFSRASLLFALFLWKKSQQLDL